MTEPLPSPEAPKSVVAVIIHSFFVIPFLITVFSVLLVGKALGEADSKRRKGELDRMAAMLSRLGGRGYQVGEEPTTYGSTEDNFDSDPDSDIDLDRRTPKEAIGGGILE